MKDEIPQRWWLTALRMLRAHHWLKNTLVFVPLLGAHAWNDPAALSSSALAFIAFCLVSSSGYVLNDVLDAPLDRRHPRKKQRPVAAGVVRPATALAVSAGLLLASLLVALTVNLMLAAAAAGYLTLTVAYSSFLKSRPLVDMLTLALLYSIRVLAGALATDIRLSFWLITFAIFLFFGLAAMKRTNELVDRDDSTALGRGYRESDKLVLVPLGVAAGVGSSLVLALYMNSSTVVELYTRPEWLWCVVPIVLLWQGGLWLATLRGTMHDDPLVFAVRFPGTYWSGFALLLLFVLAL